MERTRFNGTEEDMKEMILKLVGKDNLLSEGIFFKICYNAGLEVSNSFLQAADHACLYNERMYFFHQACGNSYAKTMDAVFILENMMRAGKVTQENILEMKSQAQFDGFVKAYGILDKLEQDESMD